jgi:hypothetical protein
MIFSSVNECVLVYGEVHEWGHDIVTSVQYGHFFVWFCCLQITIAVSSGSIGEGPTHQLDVEQWVMAEAMRSDYGKPVSNAQGKYDESMVRSPQFSKSVVKLNGIEVPVEKKKNNLEQRKRRVACWGTLLAHMCGFAAINAGGTMQQVEIFATSPVMSVVPVLLNQLFINCLFAVCKVMRDRLQAQAVAEGRKGLRAEIFDDKVTESENDVSCLAGSYLMVRSLRYLQVGIMPNMEGEIEEGVPWSCVFQLYGSGVVLVILSVLVIVIKSKSEFEEESTGARLCNILGGMFGMGFAWCCFFGSQEVFIKVPAFEHHGLGAKTMPGKVVLASVLSLIATAVIFLLDGISDLAKAGAPPGRNPGAEVVSQLVFAKSILVGVSWEKSFDLGVEAIAEMTPSPLLARSLLALFMWIILVPSWRRYILRKALVLEEYKQKQEQAEMELAGGYGKVNLEDDELALRCQPPAPVPEPVFKEEKARPMSAREVYRQVPEIQERQPLIIEKCNNFFRCGIR